ncbi:hypothetical protein DL764_001262 [Monosporascus ibericus]|uniref:Cytochrome P450 n=1 Tax=Monosporascus ibericus TaxID=155417 RepID=A0A4Q4TVA7_9PEZI|nr:hypothetical protein DL764_001262 [Monosporascus ibericus]
MIGNIITTLTTVLGAVTCVYIFLRALLNITQDAKTWQWCFEKDWFKDSSKLVQCRAQIKDGLQILQERAIIEVLGSIAILGNALPAAFWMMNHIFLDPVGLEDIRSELSKGVREVDGACAIDMAHVRESCPTLRSNFQEMFRRNAIGFSARIAMEDHVLDGKHLIKREAS